MPLTKETIYLETPDATIRAETVVEEEKMTLDEFIQMFEKYSHNFSLKEHDNYIFGKMMARTTRNKRHFLHYLDTFFFVYFNNVLNQMPPEKIKDIEKIRDKMYELKKELANSLKDVKIDDTGMMSYLIGMTEGLL